MASMILSAACLAFPLAFSARPLVRSRRFPVTRPVLFLAAPFVVWALCLIFLRMLTVLPPSGGFCLPRLGRRRMHDGSASSQEHDGQHDDQEHDYCSETDTRRLPLSLVKAPACAVMVPRA
jgi:hypothetical protein